MSTIDKSKIKFIILIVVIISLFLLVKYFNLSILPILVIAMFSDIFNTFNLLHLLASWLPGYLFDWLGWNVLLAVFLAVLGLAAWFVQQLRLDIKSL